MTSNYRICRGGYIALFESGKCCVLRLIGLIAHGAPERARSQFEDLDVD